MLATVFLVIALLLFLGAAFLTPQPGRPLLFPLGAAFVVAAMLVPLVD
jgi:hypothetical protein